VDLYHFQITGPGRFAFQAEVFAGRIGSPLDAGLSLFQLSPADGWLYLVVSNDQSLNATTATDANRPSFSDQPLFTDPALFTGLTAGDYYLAVSASPNVPDTVNNLPGTNGVFDPSVSHSGLFGLFSGPYVLNLQAQPEPNTPPHVVSIAPGPGQLLSAPPTQLTVQFDKPLNLREATFQAWTQGTPASDDPLYVKAADGTAYAPRLVSYDPATGVATFLMLDALPNGTYQLILAGDSGVTDFAGNPLAGNQPDGDYVVPFVVQGPERGSDGNPLLWTAQPPNGNPAPGCAIPARAERPRRDDRPRLHRSRAWIDEPHGRLLPDTGVAKAGIRVRTDRLERAGRGESGSRRRIRQGLRRAAR
jgi:hypothetical protein